ncbi:MAG: ArsR/SmtB family transcription factor [Candidatus Kariarchaeaceae archaeon]
MNSTISSNKVKDNKKINNENLLDPTAHAKLLNRQSEFCKLFTNKYRLQIIQALTDMKPNPDDSSKMIKVPVELNVTEIEKKIKDLFSIEINQTTLSQHLSLLRKQGAVISRREGNNVYYKIANPKLIKACMLIREIIQDLLEKEVEFSASISR